MIGVILDQAQNPSVVALGCLDEEDERGDGQGRYSS